MVYWDGFNTTDDIVSHGGGCNFSSMSKLQLRFNWTPLN